MRISRGDHQHDIRFFAPHGRIDVEDALRHVWIRRRSDPHPVTAPDVAISSFSPTQYSPCMLPCSPSYGHSVHSVSGADGGKLAWKQDATLPVSAAVRSIVALVGQFFIILTAVAILRTTAELSGKGPSAALQAFQMARGTLTLVPMICCLFLAIRMRALQLAQGQTEKYNLPTPGMQSSMTAIATLINIQAVLVLAMPLFGKQPAVDSDGNLVVSGEDQHRSMGAKVRTRTPFSWARRS